MYVTPSTPRLRFLIPLALGGALLVSAITFAFLGPFAGIKSLYAVIGLGLAAWIYSDDYLYGVEGQPGFEQRSRLAGKTTFAIVGTGLFAVLFATVAESVTPSAVRAVTLLACLPIGYLLVTLQIRWQAPSTWVLAQLSALFAFSPVLQYVTTDFYFDRGDTAVHVYWTDLVVAEGTWQAIPESSHYLDFPGFHLLLASVSVLGHVAPYDVYILVGILCLSSLIWLTYCFAKRTIDGRVTALFIALGLTVLAPIVGHTTYLYPQAFAVMILYYLLYIAFRVGDDTTPGGYAILSFYLGALLVVSHHLTAVLLLPVVLVFNAVPVVIRWWANTGSVAFDQSEIHRPWTAPLVGYVVASVLYWVYRETFIGAFIDSLQVIISGQLFAEGDGQDVIPIQTLGYHLPPPTSWDAATSLVSPEGLYQITLLCLLALGSITILRRWRTYRAGLLILLLGIGGSILFLRIPLSIPGLNRLALVFSVFVAFVVGIGLTHFLATSAPTPTSFVPVLIVLLVLSTATPILAANDLYALHAGPSLWENQPTPDLQREFTDEEMDGMERAALFLQRAETVPATDWHSQVGMNRYGTETEMMVVGDGQIQTESHLLLYRQRWTDHSLFLTPAQLSFIRVVIGDEWKDDLVATEHKVYSTGEVGMLAEREGSEAFVRIENKADHDG